MSVIYFFLQETISVLFCFRFWREKKSTTFLWLLVIKDTASLVYLLKAKPEKYISLKREEKIIDIFLLASGWGKQEHYILCILDRKQRRSFSRAS